MAWTRDAYHQHFAADLETLKQDGRYRTFAVLERLSGEFPHARMHDERGSNGRSSVCASN